MQATYHIVHMLFSFTDRRPVKRIPWSYHRDLRRVKWGRRLSTWIQPTCTPLTTSEIQKQLQCCGPFSRYAMPLSVLWHL